MSQSGIADQDDEARGNDAEQDDHASRVDILHQLELPPNRFTAQV